MDIPTTIYNLGDSFAVRIPSEMVKELGLRKFKRASVKDTAKDKIEISFSQ